MKTQLGILALAWLCFANCSPGGGQPEVEDGKVYSIAEFHSLRAFSGCVVRYEELGIPEKKHENSGPIVRVYIKTVDGKRCQVDNFKCGKIGLEEMKRAIREKTKCSLPYDVYNYRDSILWD